MFASANMHAWGEEWAACILLFASANMHAWGGGVGGVYTTVCFCEHACMHAWGGGVGGVYTTGSQTIQYLADLEKTDFCDSQTIMQAKIIEG